MISAFLLPLALVQMGEITARLNDVNGTHIAAPVIGESRVPEAVSSGGQIFITTGMIARLDESELAFVVAHEMAHVQGVKSERKADAIARVTISKAGYDTDAPRRVFRKFWWRFLFSGRG